MKKAISIPDLLAGEKITEPKGIEFTHYLTGERGWTESAYKSSEFKEVVYLGKCKHDGDVFSTVDGAGFIRIFKGYLNNGTY